MLPEAGQPAGGCRFRRLPIVVVVEDGEQRRRRNAARQALHAAHLPQRGPRPAWAPKRDAEAKGYDVFHDVFHGEGTQRGVLRSGEPLLRVAEANSLRVRDGQAQWVWWLLPKTQPAPWR
jgi:hypothetical protein